MFLSGRTTAHDLKAFVLESASSPMENLGPEDFPERVIDSKEPWFVDFFAPVGTSYLFIIIILLLLTVMFYLYQAMV